MMAQLEQIRLDAQKHSEMNRQAREGSEVKGHVRNYGHYEIWIEAHTRAAHTISRKVKK